MAEALMITWTVSIEHAQLIVNIVGEGPYNRVKPVLETLQTQAEPQIKRFEQQRQQEMAHEGEIIPPQAAKPNGDARQAA